MILICQSIFNESVTSRLAEAAIEVIQKAGKTYHHLKVPGALELPLIIQSAWHRSQLEKKTLEGVIACGCVVKGETYHFEVVANESARGLSQVSLELNLPIMNAVLTTYDYEQAFDRAGGKLGNKGAEAAESLLKILSLLA